jgi:hypothetical protein
MRRSSEARGARFYVLLLEYVGPGNRRLEHFLKRQGIGTIDCMFVITDAMRVPGEGHPNSRLNERWAACIEQALAAELNPSEP